MYVHTYVHLLELVIGISTEGCYYFMPVQKTAGRRMVMALLWHNCRMRNILVVNYAQIKHEQQPWHVSL